MLRSEIGSVVGGVVGGAIATAFMQKGMQLSGRLPEPVRPPPMREDPGEYLVEQLESRRGEPLAPATHRRAARGLHWVYGIGWSSLLALFGPKLRMEKLGCATAAGAALGAGVWAVGYAGWLPRTGLTAPLREQGLAHSVSALLSHVAYGIVAALPIHLANRAVARSG